MMINPHTGLPVDFRGVDAGMDPSYGAELARVLGAMSPEVLQMLGIGALPNTRSTVDGGANRGQGFAYADPNSADGQQMAELLRLMDGYGFGQSRQDYMVTDHLQAPDGSIISGNPYERRENNDRELATGLAAFAAMAAGGGALLGGTGGTATLGAGSLAAPIGTSAALPTLGAAAMPTAASLGIGELAAIGGGLAGGGIGTLGTIAPSAATTASSALPTLGQAPAFSAGGLTLPSLSQISGGVSLADAVSNAGGSGGLLEGAGSLIAPLVGGVVGAIDGAQGSEDSTTTQSRLDPNMQRLLYGEDGKGGLLGDMAKHFQGNMGINPTAQQGLNMQKAFYNDPAYAQGYGQMRSQGLGLLGQPVAGNPFMRKGG